MAVSKTDLVFKRKPIRDILAEIINGSIDSIEKVKVATENNENTYIQQFISLTIGSASAVKMNLMTSLIEPLNLYLSTQLYLGMLVSDTSDTLTIHDHKASLVSGTSSYLPGLINPAHLRLAAHFNGEGNIPSSIVSADSPVYNSNLFSVAKWNITNPVAVTKPISDSIFSGGTPSSSTLLSGTATEAFDNNPSTYARLPSNTTCFIKYTFAEAIAVNLFYISTKSLIGYASSLVIQGSNDDTNWTNISNVYSINTTNIIELYIPSQTSVAYRYYRISSTTSGNGLYIYEFQGFSESVAKYDTQNKVFGTSSNLLSGLGYLYGTAQNVNQLQLKNLNWHFKGFFKFSSPTPTMCLFSIAGKQLEIFATETGLQVKYSIDGTNFVTVNSSAITWSTSEFQYISVRRTENKIYFFINGIAKGSADITGSLFESSANSFYVGADSIGTNNFSGNIDELEFFVGESVSDSIPSSARSTAYIPSVEWKSLSTYIESGLSSVGVLVFIDEATFASFGVPSASDYSVHVSFDNGITFTQVSLVKKGMLSSNTAIYEGAVQLANTTRNTNQLVYKIVSVAGKVIKFDGIIIYWD